MSIFLQLGDDKSVGTQATKPFVNLLRDIDLRNGLGTFLRNSERSSLLAPTVLELGGAIGLVNFLVREVLFNQRNEIVCLNWRGENCAQYGEKGPAINVHGVPCKSTLIRKDLSGTMRVLLLKLVTIRLSWNRTAGTFSNLFAEIVRFTSQKSLLTPRYVSLSSQIQDTGISGTGSEKLCQNEKDRLVQLDRCSVGRSEVVAPHSPCVLFQTTTVVPSSAFSKSVARTSGRLGLVHRI